MTNPTAKPQRPRWVGLATYVGLLIFAIVAFAMVQHFGMTIEAPSPPSLDTGSSSTKGHGLPLMLHVLATLTAVVALGTLLGYLCRFIGQPPVIGEVMAGIFLGPSLLGAISPEAIDFFIPPPEVDAGGKVNAALKALSQLGVVLYMFLVGLELDVVRLKHRAHAAIAISHASIAIPFVLGAVLALWIYPRFSYNNTDFTSFALFCGVAMSITAFPVLARILTDRKMQNTNLGAVALGCAAADDVTAWCLLAVVIGVAKADLNGALAVIAGALTFVAIMLLLIRPILRWGTNKIEREHDNIPQIVMSITFALVLICAFTTESIGIHSLFGAFLLGAIVPNNSRIGRLFTERVKDPVNILLLPAFFAFTGMRTQIGLVQGFDNFVWCIVIIMVATVGKFGGTLIAARVSGETWRDSAALGTLMNTRGLMELIVLNIGLDMGIITPRLFTMMVIMAIATTIATAPILRWLIPDEKSLDLTLTP